MFKKLFLSVLLSLGTLPVTAVEEITPPGLAWGSSLGSIATWGKGAGLKEGKLTDSKESYGFMSGSFAGRQVFVALGVTCSEYGLHTVRIVYETDAANFRHDFDYFVDLFQRKYGEPTNKYDFVQSPYDKSEMYSAIRAGKGALTSYWFTKGTTLMIEVTDKGRIAISYQNSALFKSCGEAEKTRLKDQI